MPELPWSPDEFHQSFIRRFDRVVAAFPDKPALLFPGNPLSYRDLEDRSRRVGALLGDTDPARPVALMLSDGVATLKAMLGALRAGRIYLVLEPDLPQARMAEVLRHARAGALLADEQRLPSAQALAGADRRVIKYAEPDPPAGHRFDGERLSGGDPAALMYTSGSTGTPKGILWRHDNLLHKAYSLFTDLGLRVDDTYADLHSLSFGASTATVFTALLSGGSFTLLPMSRHSLHELANHLRQYRITFLLPPAGLFRALLDVADPGDFRHVRTTLLTGERVYPRDLERWKAAFPRGGSFLHIYSATETNVVSFARFDHDSIVSTPFLHAGKAASDKSFRIVDAGLNPLPPGSSGEIEVRSAYLCGGYWEEPDATQQAFQSAGDVPEERRFLTGDHGRIDPDGNLVLEARRDQRVKIRGYRIDTMEIEARLLENHRLRETAVVPVNPGEPGGGRLTAYYATRDGRPIEPTAFRGHLEIRLPDYMIPSTFVHLPELPKTPNGKIDRRNLESRPPTRLSIPGAAAPPATPAERRLAPLWREVLPVRDFGTDVSFFDLGGTSLAALDLLERIRRDFGTEIPLPLFHQRSTLRELAGLLDETERTEESSPYSLELRPGTEPAFFCIPGFGSDATTLADVAAAFPEGRPFVGLQYPGPRSGTTWFRSIPELAERFAEEIIRIQPRGPFHIGGSSGGGVVAFELARVLGDRYGEVGVVALLDTHCSAPDPAKLFPLPGWWRQRVRGLLPVGCRVLNLEMLRQGRQQRLRQRKIRENGVLEPGGEGLSQEERYLRLLDACRNADRQYRYAPYPGTLTLFRAWQRRFLLETPAPDLRWRPYCARLEVVEIPGYHGEHIRNPHAPTLAEKLVRRIREWESVNG